MSEKSNLSPELVNYWRAMLSVPCYCYSAENPGGGCDACAARHPMSYLQGEDLRCALRAVNDYHATEYRKADI